MFQWKNIRSSNLLKTHGRYQSINNLSVKVNHPSMTKYSMLQQSQKMSPLNIQNVIT